LLGANVSHVFGSLATHVFERTDKATNETRPVTSDDEANLLLRFANGALTKNTTGAVSMSMVESGAPEHRLEIFGSRGALMVKEPDELWHSTIGSNDWTRLETPQTEIAQGMRDSGWSRGFTTYARAIIEALHEGQSSIEGAATFRDGYKTQLVLDAARQSHESGCWIEIKDPQS
jgi:predicted dehydrogenase